MKLSVLMPVYNEIGTIAEIVKLVAAALPDIEKELVIVDDGSRDEAYPAVPGGPRCGMRA
jgi:glycosyltransferase involved in cell wall biosynthesis